MSPLRRVFSVVVRLLGSVVLLGLCLLLIGGFVLLLRALTHETQDDMEHVREKEAYLTSLKESSSRTTEERPNILIILFDDLGYGDLGVTGASSLSTPHIDKLAAEGVRFTQYYAPSPVCTSSRAALLTGRYPERTLFNIVAFPSGHPIDWIMRATQAPATRLVEEEILLPEILKAAGYNNGMVGKWHLGDQAPSRPVDRAFDFYVGALYSNDMTPFAIYRDDQIEHEAPFDQTQMKRVYEDAALEFLEQERDAPFFLYFAHNFPHIPLHAPAVDRGRSRAGLYGDVVEGLDDTVGTVLSALRKSGDLENTLVIVTSDNGPWYEGSPGAARGRKNQTWEGGMRVPFIAHWPKRIAAGRVSDAPIVGVDLVPTLLSLLALPAPADRELDGRDLGAHLFDGAEPADRYVYYYSQGQMGSGELDAVRGPRFKYHRRRGVRTGGSDRYSVNTDQGPWLFDLTLDPSESFDVSMRYPADFARLESAFKARASEDQANQRGWR